MDNNSSVYSMQRTLQWISNTFYTYEKLPYKKRPYKNDRMKNDNIKNITDPSRKKFARLSL
jgi:hypothetical protein